VTSREDPPIAKRLLPLAREIEADIVMPSSGPGGWMRRLLPDALLEGIRHADRPIFLSH